MSQYVTEDEEANSPQPDGDHPTEQSVFAIAPSRLSASSFTGLPVERDNGDHSVSHAASANRNKVVNDPVHGLYELNSILFQWIDNPVFQRLRDLKQLGGMYLVFPGASHNRFEHSLGTCYLAGRWMRHFRDQLQGSQGDNPVISERDVFLVQVAALCHDLGHGPFSHTFEDVFIEKRKEKLGDWDHEKVSCSLVKMINEELISRENEGNMSMPDAILSNDEVEIVQNLILGEEPKELQRYKRFMYQIVHNSSSGIDVDKMDYMLRDCYSSHLPLGHDAYRIMKFARIVDGEICWPEQMAYGLFKLFETRFSLHKQMYSHRVIKAVELMIGDILHAADDILQITNILENQDLARYVHLTDSLLNDIERRPEDPKNDSLTAAKKLLKRLRGRDLYQLVTELVIINSATTDQRKLARELMDSLRKFFKDEKVVICSCNFHYGMKDVNPLSKVSFISTENPEPHMLDQNALSRLIGTLPSHFCEVNIRIYITERAPGARKRVLEKFDEWTREETRGKEKKWYSLKRTRLSITSEGHPENEDEESEMKRQKK